MRKYLQNVRHFLAYNDILDDLVGEIDPLGSCSLAGLHHPCWQYANRCIVYAFRRENHTRIDGIDCDSRHRK